MHWIDWLVIAGYFAALIVVVWWSSRKQSTTEDYFLAGRNIGIWYWCTDQYIVQRTLAAKNLSTARRGAIWGGFLKVWPVMNYEFGLKAETILKDLF